MSQDHLTDDVGRTAYHAPARRRLAWLLCVAAMSAGCGGGRGSGPETDATARFTPAPELARAAVQAVLDDWKDGRAPGRIERLTVAVQAVDNRRRPGQRLEEFEILGETPGSGAARCFAVRVRLRSPEAEEKLRFAVVGIDPLWVFRQEDMDSLAQWDCAPDGGPPPTTGDKNAGDGLAGLDADAIRPGGLAAGKEAPAEVIDSQSPELKE